MQITTKLGYNDRLARCDFHKTRIGLAHFKRQTFRAIRCHGCGWSVDTESDPVAIVFTRKITFETVPVGLRLIEPVDVPDPLQIIGALGAHQINDTPVRCDVACRTFSGAAVPLAVPAEPVSVRLSPPFYQNRFAKFFGITRPCAKIL